MTDAAWLALRVAGLVLLFQAAGAILYFVTCGQALAQQPVLRRRTERTALLALGLLAAQLAVEPAHLAGAWSGLADPALWQLTFRRAAPPLDVRGAGLALLALALRATGRRGPGFALAGSLVALASLLPGGHAGLSAHASLLYTLLALHVLIGSFWFGSLAPLREGARCLPARELALVLGAFSRYAGYLVPLTAVSGVLMAWLLLPGWRALLEPYGLLLCGKALLFAVLLALAALNRWRFTPALARGVHSARRSLARSLAWEFALIIAVLALTGLLTGFFSPS
ncbi:MAG TPA: CopD family protein [Steroidobacteraceae bacterium]|jgi:putative copper resistance protein D|nr:CopD family protein [Steroidobacteraceae bacterium]